MNLAGKRIFITGASSGIGAAVAKEFAQRGARVALAARREQRLAEVQTAITDAGGEALSVCCDVTNRADLDAAVATVVDAWGGIDIVIANAGFGVSGPFERVTTEDWRRQFDVNLFGVVDTIYATLPHLEASRGNLAIVASILGRFGMSTSSVYCASKFALCGLAESIAYELRPKGITVTCINPGIVESEIRSVNNRGVFTGAQQDPAPRLLRVPADRAARAIVRAIAKGKAEAVITGHGKMLTWANRHFPRLFRTGMRLVTPKDIARVERMKRGNTNREA